MYHLKLVGRQIFQRKGYFVINTIGLAVALTASVLIYTFLVKEWQTNTYHKNVDHIYRITVQTDGYAYWGSEVCSSLGEIAKAELPEVTDYTLHENISITTPEIFLYGKPFCVFIR